MPLPIEEMSIEEKLRTMEALWADLTKKEEEFLSPAWHNDILKSRQQRIQSGEVKYQDWEGAKKELRNQLL